MPTNARAWLTSGMATSVSSKLKRKLDEAVAAESAEKRSKCDGALTGRKCNFSFYDSPCEELARKLLGCVLVFSQKAEDTGQSLDESSHCWGRIVETEAYLGGEDKAAHSYGGKRTNRNEAMYMPPGTSYVYSIYGMHCCFNISSRGEGAAVLVRAIQPLGGLEQMRASRKAAKSDKQLCNGPAKLCQAMGIDKTCNKLDLTSSNRMWVELLDTDEGSGHEVVESTRVGIDYAGEEWARKLLRFYVKGSSFISKK